MTGCRTDPYEFQTTIASKAARCRPPPGVRN